MSLNSRWFIGGVVFGALVVMADYMVNPAHLPGVLDFVTDGLIYGTVGLLVAWAVTFARKFIALQRSGR